MKKNDSYVSNFYDVVWTEYLPNYKESKEHLELFFNDAEIIGKDILDSGCGTGIFSSIFAEKGAKKVVGIDISEGSLSTAKNLKEKFHLDNLILKKENMLILPFDDNCFDIVWAWGTVHHTTNPLKAIDELSRVLKPEGTILLAIYKKTLITPIHEIIRNICIRLPRFLWIPVSKSMTIFLTPIVFFFKKREKLRKGEKLEELILDWYFVPIRFHYTPEEIKNILESRNYEILKYIPASGRFDSTSNFIYKAKKKSSYIR